MDNPYTTIIISTNISLHPSQLNNNLDINLKNNLINKFEGKCFENYGYIHKIYDITRKSIGYIIPENPLCASTYVVDFVCRICNPIKGMNIICRILRMNNSLICSECGAIRIINNISKINPDLFLIDKNGSIIYRKTNTKIDVGTFLKMNILSKTFNSNDDRIIAIGNIIDVVSDDEDIRLFHSYEYDSKIEEKLEDKTV